MAEKKNKEISFEDATARLEEIVKALESGNAPLDESLKLFEEGIKLVSSCKKQLDNAEQRVKLLMENGNGEDDETDFVGTEQ
ncbi:MAG: exodeoxyribonuclease VII small subunit [Clostridia bacterium]|nr:exodeoxyribonuclease VII small subunit [Clostridia bacterium]